VIKLSLISRCINDTQSHIQIGMYNSLFFEMSKYVSDLSRLKLYGSSRKKFLLKYSFFKLHRFENVHGIVSSLLSVRSSSISVCKSPKLSGSVFNQLPLNVNFVMLRRLPNDSGSSINIYSCKSR
jgi:hypothetical protein